MKGRIDASVRDLPCPLYYFGDLFSKAIESVNRPTFFNANQCPVIFFKDRCDSILELPHVVCPLDDVGASFRVAELSGWGDHFNTPIHNSFIEITLA